LTSQDESPGVNYIHSVLSGIYSDPVLGNEEWETGNEKVDPSLQGSWNYESGNGILDV